jgi:hypothetical protein
VPEWGCFTGPDALVKLEPNGPCNYLFAENNPLRYVDPEGLDMTCRIEEISCKVVSEWEPSFVGVIMVKHNEDPRKVVNVTPTLRDLTEQYKDLKDYVKRLKSPHKLLRQMADMTDSQYRAYQYAFRFKRIVRWRSSVTTAVSIYGIDMLTWGSTEVEWHQKEQLTDWVIAPLNNPRAGVQLVLPGEHEASIAAQSARKKLRDGTFLQWMYFPMYEREGRGEDSRHFVKLISYAPEKEKFISTRYGVEGDEDTSIELEEKHFKILRKEWRETRDAYLKWLRNLPNPNDDWIWALDHWDQLKPVRDN